LPPPPDPPVAPLAPVTVFVLVVAAVSDCVVVEDPRFSLHAVVNRSARKSTLAYFIEYLLVSVER